jgi:hypothetical protein
MINDNSSNNVLYLNPIQICGHDLHSIMKLIREKYLPYHIKTGLWNSIPPSYLYYSMNIVSLDEDMFSENSYRVKLSNIRNFNKYKERYLKLKDYILDRAEKYYKESDIRNEV